ncbi:protein DBF4 homolog A [Eleutherodactylus coqui]|uniref:protein DBF4 homolog A n=1 Tax=Eleutherodactylus coqui TaxID=57060 RepID=UPI0034633198
MQRNKGGTQGRGVKMKPAQPTAIKLPDKAAAHKPLAGRVFYLDIASRLVAEKLEKDIKELGGTVEGFLSKEISCLITSKKEAKCTKSLKYPCSMPSPEPASGSGSTRPSGHKGDVKNGGSSKKPEKEDVSRGKSLLKKVIKEQEFFSKTSILANALNWGVRILHLDEAKIYIDQKKRSLQQVKQTEQLDVSMKPVAKRPARRKVKAQKLKSPFIKVEDSSCHYRPLYLVSPLFKSFQSSLSKLCRPVDKKPDTAPKPTETKQSLNKTWHGQDEGNVSHTKCKEQKRRGYCECCLQKYADLEAHLLSQQHKNYAVGPHYQDVDNLITAFKFDFVDWSKFKQETQGTGLFIPPPTLKQEEKFPPQMNQISAKLSSVHNLEPGVPGAESTQPQGAACTLVNNLAHHSEPTFATPCLPQSRCSISCVTESFSKAPSSQVISPTHESLPLTPLAESVNLSPDHNSSAQKDLEPKESDTRTFLNVELSAALDQSCSRLPVNGCLSKRLKLDDSLVETDTVSVAPAVLQTEPTKDLEESCTLWQSPPLSPLPHSSSPNKLHRKVKRLERKARKQEQLPHGSCRVSVPFENCNVGVSKDGLEGLFQSSDCHSEFYGFSCNSVDGMQCIEDLEEPLSSHGCVLWSLFSNTSSSASTFNGF